MMNVPKLRFKEFDGVWGETTLGSQTKWSSGGTPPRDNPEYWDGEISWFSASSMRGMIYSNADTKITELGLKNGSKLAKKDSLLLLVRGSMLFNKIPVGILKYDAAFNQDVKSIEVSKSITVLFLLYWFYASENKLLNLVSGTGIGAGKLDTKELQDLFIFSPSLPEQTKIANFLTAIDERINQLTRKKELMTQYKQGVMQQIFSQQLRFKDDNGEDFADWEEKRLEEVSSIFMGSSPKSEFYNEDGNGLPLLQGNADIKNRKSAPRIFTSEITRECLPDDILLSVRAPVGSVAISNHYACIGRGIAAIRANNKISQIFIYQWLLNFEEKWKSLSQGSTFDSVNSDDIKNFKVTFPTPAEQTKIANFLTVLDEKIQQISQQIEATKQYKQGLLQQMFV